jgi:ABC-type siderophore export system fused ATPase/permease subunit
VNELLPIASGDELRAQARRLGRRNRRALLGVIGLHAAAATAGLAGPAFLGALVQSVQDGTTTKHVDEIIGLLAIFLIVETILTWFARRASFVLSE